MIDSLTPRERQVYEAATTPGARHRDVASALGLTPASLSVVLSRVRLKLGVAGMRGRPEKRIGRSVADGPRCQRCHLLLPCDHMEAKAA